LNELAGNRSAEPDDHSLFSVKRSWLENRDESLNLLALLLPSSGCGQRAALDNPADDEPARDSKSAPAPEPDEDPAR
jgi:hypothetical protein